MGYDLKLFSGNANRPLAEEIAKTLQLSLGDAEVSRFSDGEVYVQINENVRGQDVFVIQPTCPPVNDHLMELLVMLDAFKRASARRITAVCPFYGYARQDRKAEGREPISARLLADMLTVAGADRLVSVDLHTGQIQGFFDGPVDHLTAVPLLADYLAREVEGEVVVVSPDAGGLKLARRYANCLGDANVESDLAFIDKRRPKGTHNVAEATDVVGNVSGGVCVLVDDMIDTAGTIVSAANLLMDRGAREVWVAATHAVLSGPAVDRLKNAPVRQVVVTNTLPIPDDKRFDTLEVLSIAPIIAEALDAVFADTSVSEIFRGDNV
jgi:ribose-phosphate pyrophosphokinase